LHLRADRIKRLTAIQAALQVRPAVVGMIFAAAVVVGRTAARFDFSRDFCRGALRADVGA
jgi:hypothetical protein